MLKYLALMQDAAGWTGPLRVFESVTFRGALGLACGFFCMLCLGPRFIAWMRRLAATEAMDKDSRALEDLHAGKRGTPTMGGLIIVVSVLITMALTCDPDEPLVRLAGVLLIGFGFLGFVDDYVKLRGRRGLNKRQKLVGQFVVVVVALALFAHMGLAHAHTTKLLIPFTKWAQVQPDLGWVYYPFFAFVIVACSNAFNLTDGLDGLASGCTIMVAVCYAVLAYVVGNEKLCDYFRIPHVFGSAELAILCAILVGTVMGFLWFNAHPAEVFMGDTGSLTLGALIAFVALTIKHELVLVLVGGIFVVEAVSVLLQVLSFRLTGRRVFKCAPYHHHLEFSGWHENKVVVRFWMIGAVLTAMGLMTLKMH